MRENQSTRRLPRWGTPLLLASMFVLGMVAGNLSSGVGQLGASSSLSDSPAFAIFEETWNLVQDRYVLEDELDDTELIYGAARGMVQAVGDVGHSAFLDPVQAEAFKASLEGTLIGIGVRLEFNGHYPLVVEPIRGSPAEEAGIEAGDLIMAIDGQDTARMTFADVGALLRGEEGIPVDLTIGRPDRDIEFDVTLQRARIQIPPVEWAELPDGLFLIRLNEFSLGAAESLEDALAESIDRSARGIVLDLRGNPGGYVSEAEAVAGQFLAQNSVLYLQRTRDEPLEEIRIEDGSGMALEIPLVVLVSETSASAAEIVAASLRDHGRAEVIGEPTFGTATVVSSFPLEDGSIAAIGTAVWQAPNGENARNVGIQPTILVQLPAEGEELNFEPGSVVSQITLDASEDTQLQAAIDLLEASAGERVA